MSRLHSRWLRSVVADVALGACRFALAGHPMLTEDTGTQGTGNEGLELGFSWANDSGDRSFLFQPQLSYGATPTLDLIVRAQPRRPRSSREPLSPLGGRPVCRERPAFARARRRSRFERRRDEIADAGRCAPRRDLYVPAGARCRRRLPRRLQQRGLRAAVAARDQVPRLALTQAKAARNPRVPVWSCALGARTHPRGIGPTTVLLSSCSPQACFLPASNRRDAGAAGKPAARLRRSEPAVPADRRQRPDREQRRLRTPVSGS